MAGAAELHFDWVTIILSLMVALVFAWTSGMWLGAWVTRRAQGTEQPPRTVRGLMTLVFVAGLALPLMAGDPSVLLYAIVLIPPIAWLRYVSRSG